MNSKTTLFNHAETQVRTRGMDGFSLADYVHWGGEEMFVIEGTFQDGHGDYPAGSWLRSPHRSRHNPWPDEGCVIYVKAGHLPA